MQKNPLNDDIQDDEEELNEASQQPEWTEFLKTNGKIKTVFDQIFITFARTPTSTQLSSFLILRLQPVYLLLLHKSMFCRYSFELRQFR